MEIIVANEAVITVPGTPPSLNEILGLHWTKRNRVKKEWHGLVHYAWVQSKKPRFNEVTIRITYYFKTKHKRDYDNYSGKFLLDGLKGGAITDDNQDIIQSLTHAFRYDKENPRTEISIRNVNKGD